MQLQPICWERVSLVRSKGSAKLQLPQIIWELFIVASCRDAAAANFLGAVFAKRRKVQGHIYRQLPGNRFFLLRRGAKTPLGGKSADRQ